MANVDLDINLDNDTIEDLIAIYIRTNMSSASYEVFERERADDVINVREAAGCALLNEAIISAIEIGMKMDKLADDLLEKEDKNE